MQQLLALRYVTVGGAVGALTQWGVLSIAPDDRTTEAILGLNIVGSVLMGILVGQSWTRDRRRRVTTNQFLLVGTGFCGALTTFSTYAVQVASALDDGSIVTAVTTGLTTACTAVIGAGLGYRIGSRP